MGSMGESGLRIECRSRFKCLRRRLRGHDRPRSRGKFGMWAGLQAGIGILAPGLADDRCEPVAEARWLRESRVLDEDWEPMKPQVLEGLRESVAGLTGSEERAKAVLKWVWSDHGDDSLIVLESHTAENRNRSVNQLLASRQSACREFNLFYVTALRAVGIPARHCTVARWLHRDSYHFFAEYWDAERERWVTVDTSDDKVLQAETPAERAANGRWNSLVYYAYPEHPDESDLYGKGRWDKMTPITSDLAELFPMEIGWPDPERSGRLSAQIWNGGSWRTILIRHVAAGEATVVVEFGKTQVTSRPVLFSADIDGVRYLALVGAVPGDGRVELKPVEHGASLAWSPVGEGMMGGGER